MTFSAEAETSTILVGHDPVRLTGRLSLTVKSDSSIWERFRSRVFSDPAGRELSNNQLELPWPSTLSILREFGTKQQQQTFGFHFKFEEE